MATVTHRGTTFTTATGAKTVVATPAVGDLIVVIAASTGVPTTAVSDTQSGTYVQIDSNRTGFSTTGTLSAWVRTALIPAASSTTFTASQSISSSGGGLTVMSISGITRVGAAAIRSWGGQTAMATGTTPAPVLTQVPLTGNPVITAVANGASTGAIVTPRTGYTEVFDAGYATPNCGLEVAYRASGETAAILTYGSTVTSVWASIALEVDTSAPAPVISQAAYNFYEDGTETGSAVASNITTYYFDAHVGTPSDPGAVWVNDANAFNGDTTTLAQNQSSTAGSNSSQYLEGKGTTAPTSGAVISQVRSRIFYLAGDTASPVITGAYDVATSSRTEILGTQTGLTTVDSIGSSRKWSNYTILTTPSGGWTWSALNTLETRIWKTTTSPNFNAYRIEIEVTTVRDVTSDSNLGLRIRLQEASGNTGITTDDYQLQYSLNSAIYLNIGMSTIGSIIDSYSESNTDTDITLNTASRTGVAQSFTGTGIAIGYAQFYLKKNIVATGNAVAKVYAHSGTFGTSSIPTGSALATSDSFDVSTLTTSYQLIAFNFSGANRITLANGTRYVISVEWTSATDSQEVDVGADGSSPTHSGSTSTLVGSWNSTTGVDTVFYVNGIGGIGVNSYNSASLTDSGATTNRLGAGNGSFVAGEVSETGLVTDSQLTASNYTEHLYSLTLVAASLANNDTLDFRVLRNGVILNSYTVTPRITVSKTAGGSALTQPLSDSVTTTDNGTAKTARKITGDTSTSSDTSYRAPRKVAADTVTISDTSARSTVKAITDSATATDFIAATLVSIKALTDSVTPADVTSANVIHQIADSVTATDSRASINNYSRTFSDTSTASDAISNRPTKNSADTTTTSDTSARNPRKNTADTVTPTDARTFSRGIVLNLSDAATTSDTTSKNIKSVRADTATPTDAAQRIWAYGLRPIDSVTATDSQTRSSAIARPQTDSVTTSDASYRAAQKNLIDTATTLDATAKADTRSLSDSAAATDSMTATLISVKTLADTVAPSDMMVMNTKHVISDTATATDVRGGTTTYYRTAADTVTPTDTISLRPSRTIADTVTTTDNNAIALKHRHFDTVTPTDTITTAHAFYFALTDSVTTSDSSIRKPQLNRTDSVTTTDSTAKTLARQLTDTSTVSDSSIRKVVRAQADTVTPVDQFTRTVQFFRTFADTVTPNDARPATYTLRLSDSITSTDLIVRKVMKLNSDSTVPTDVITRSLIKQIVDSVTVTDLATPQKLGVFSPRFDDTVTVSDAIRFAAIRRQTDTATTMDQTASSVGKRLIDSAATSDSIIKRPVIVRLDTSITSDTIAKLITLGRADFVTAVDAKIYAQRYSLADVASVTELQTRFTQKRLVDSVTALEQFSVGAIRLFDTATITEALRVFLNGINVIAPQIFATAPTMKQANVLGQQPRTAVILTPPRVTTLSTLSAPRMAVTINDRPRVDQKRRLGLSGADDGTLSDSVSALADDTTVVTGSPLSLNEVPSNPKVTDRMIMSTRTS